VYSIRNINAYNVHGSSSAEPTQATRAAAGSPPPGDVISLTTAMLSNHARTQLAAQEAADSEQKENLASRVKEAIRAHQLKLLPNQSPNGIARFETQSDGGLLAIEAKLNESSKYDVLSIEFEKNSEALLSIKFSASSTSPAERLPKELVHMVLDNLPSGGVKSRVTSLALSSKTFYALGLEKTLAKVKCSDSLDRLTAMKNIPEYRGPDGRGSARLAEFKAILGSLDKFRGKEKMDLIEALVDNIPHLEFESSNGFKLMLDLIEKLGRSKILKSVDSEHRAALIRDRNKTVANVVSKLSEAGTGIKVSAEDRVEVFERLLLALEGLEGRNGANHAAAALPKLAAWYFWHPEALGPEQFGKLIALADRNKLNMSDESRSEVVVGFAPMLAEHGEAEHIANHFNVLCEISKTIEKDETKANIMTHMIEHLNLINDEALREISRHHLAEAVGTLDNPLLKAQVAAVPSALQND
jgi:hypothetical protein